ncbi:hypothetical protein LIER_23028 [Lithospermum erythrorhizon]|uniref:Retrotransposon gag domain-containing protein n=1 Tax=Lithospermum erythrorhizon TaxID=34254 RepID=A0AAV3QVX9_LITER
MCGRCSLGVVDSPSCIVLDEATKNYELKCFHFQQLPNFHGMAHEDPLTFLNQFSIMMHKKFVVRFYTYAKSASLRKQISNFTQEDGESFHEACDRFRTLLIQCPHHLLPPELQHSYFYDGLTPTYQTMVDNAAGGVLGGKTVREIQEIFESLATNSLQKGVRGNPRGVYGINANLDVTKQLASLQMQIEKLTMSKEGSTVQVPTCFYLMKGFLEAWNK